MREFGTIQEFCPESESNLELNKNIHTRSSQVLENFEVNSNAIFMINKN